jgi:hypothetical protein
MYLEHMVAQALHEENEERLRTYQRQLGYAPLPRRALLPDPLVLAWHQLMARVHAAVAGAPQPQPTPQRMTESAAGGMTR